MSKFVEMQMKLRDGIQNPKYAITTYTMPIQSGKTSTIQIELSNDPNAIVIVGQFSSVKHYDESLRSRVFTVSDIVEQGKLRGLPRPSKVIIDEGYYSSPSWIKLYYLLGQMQITTIVVGS